MSPVLKLGNLWERSEKIFILFGWGRPGVLYRCQRSRKPITNVCGMIPERCGPPPARTTHSKGVWSVMTSLSSVDEPPEPPDESKKQCEGKWHFLVAKPLALASRSFSGSSGGPPGSSKLERLAPSLQTLPECTVRVRDRL